mmetsp:Transcript_5657/g.15948  ORF Transcript_5657/g.15948 Transcript_5657/m.15948 type:complete len:367 (+) Transcript_5657:379-1479(+)
MLLDERKQREALEAGQTANASVHSAFPSSPATFATAASNQDLLDSQAVLMQSVASLVDQSSREKEDDNRVKWDKSSFPDYTDSKYTIKFLRNFKDHARTHRVADILEDDYVIPDKDTDPKGFEHFTNKDSYVYSSLLDSVKFQEAKNLIERDDYRPSGRKCFFAIRDKFHGQVKGKLDAERLINELYNIRSSDFKSMSKFLTTWESKMTLCESIVADEEFMSDPAKLRHFRTAIKHSSEYDEVERLDGLHVDLGQPKLEYQAYFDLIDKHSKILADCKLDKTVANRKANQAERSPAKDSTGKDPHRNLIRRRVRIVPRRKNLRTPRRSPRKVIRPRVATRCYLVRNGRRCHLKNRRRIWLRRRNVT